MDIAHRVGAVVVADGVSYAPHRMVDVKQLGADVYVFSTYKTFGTHLGVMWIKRDVQERITCQGHYFNRDRPRYRMNPTGPLHAEVAALAGIGEYYDRLYRYHFADAGLSRLRRAQCVFGLFAEHETASGQPVAGCASRVARCADHWSAQRDPGSSCAHHFVCVRTNAIARTGTAAGGTQDRGPQRALLRVAVPRSTRHCRSRGRCAARQHGPLQHARGSCAAGGASAGGSRRQGGGIQDLRLHDFRFAK